MIFIEGTELNTYVVVRIKSDGRSERITSFHDEKLAKAYIEKLFVDQPGDYDVLTIIGGKIQ